MMDSQKICTVLGGCLHAYEIPPLPIEPTSRQDSVENLAMQQRLASAQSSLATSSSEKSKAVQQGSSAPPSEAPDLQTHGETTSAEPTANLEVNNSQRQPQATVDAASMVSRSPVRSPPSPLPSSVFEGFVFALHRKTVSALGVQAIFVACLFCFCFSWTFLA